MKKNKKIINKINKIIIFYKILLEIIPDLILLGPELIFSLQKVYGN